MPAEFGGAFNEFVYVTLGLSEFLFHVFAGLFDCIQFGGHA